MKYVAFVVLGICLVAGGCTTAGFDRLAVNDTLREVCGGYTTDDNSILYIISIADADREAGYSKSYETTVFLETCAMQAGYDQAFYDACGQCRTAILDQVYGG